MEEEFLSLLDESLNVNTSSNTDVFQKSPNKFNFKKDNIDYSKITEPHVIDVSKFNTSIKSYTILYNIKNTLPENVISKILAISKFLNSKDFIYRLSNDDKAILENKICGIENIKIEAYLPWKKYNLGVSETFETIYPSESSAKLLLAYNKSYAKLSNGLKNIVSSQYQSLLGKDLTTPVKFIIMYTECGLERRLTKEDKDAKYDYTSIGNLVPLLNIANDANIPIFNLKKEDAMDRLKEYLKSLNL